MKEFLKVTCIRLTFICPCDIISALRKPVILSKGSDQIYD